MHARKFEPGPGTFVLFPIFLSAAFVVLQLFRSGTSPPFTVTSPPPQQKLIYFGTLTVSWQYGHAHPSGEAVEVKAGEVTVTSARGNDITKTGTEADPAVHISRPGGNDVVQRASKLTIDEEGPNHQHGNAGEGGSAQAAGDDDGDDGEADDGKVEEKKSAAAAAPKKGGRGRPKKAATGAAGASVAGGAAEKKKKAPAVKKTPAKKAKAPAAADKEAKETSTGNANGEKKKGRPKSSAVKEDAKPKKRAATDDGELRRSKRNKT